ncbi:MAG TPA: hypothetical protein VK797_04750 [Tepidisphaeraceae bacterium]|jgi:hypothetical protein|nr:hypothetical protein [Tepidisphaeraceae bacterium]
MALLTKAELLSALTRLGELANAQGGQIELIIFGGALMVLQFGTRESTRDVDAIILSPPDLSSVRAIAKAVADERGWPEDWINDAVKGFVMSVKPESDLWEEAHGAD